MFENDKFFNNCTQIEKDEILNSKSTGAATLSTGKWHGWIQNCPQCKELRITGCSACGCGHCYTCNYRFTCLPWFAILDKVEILNVKFE